MAPVANPIRRDHGLRRSAIAREILQAVFLGELQAGERLTLQRLGRRFGVSMTPIREALVELAGIGVVELQPNRGAVLRAFGVRQLRDICHVRKLLEAEAARCACGRIAPVELRELADALRQLIDGPRGLRWSEATRDLDTRLHELLAAHCGNERLAEEIGRYRLLYRTLRDVYHLRRQSQNDYRHMDENAEHLEIVEAVLRGDQRAAAEAMSRHIDVAAKVVEDELIRSTKPKTRRAAAASGGRR